VIYALGPLTSDRRVALGGNFFGLDQPRNPELRQALKRRLVRRLLLATQGGAKGATAQTETVFKTVAFVRSAILPGCESSLSPCHGWFPSPLSVLRSAICTGVFLPQFEIGTPAVAMPHPEVP
jgi:hypothetical protein